MKTRLRGLIFTISGIVLFFGVFLLLGGSLYQPGRGHDQGAIRFLVAPPLVLALIGAIELVSGLPFWQIAQKWDSMNGLVRFLLGLVIIIMVIPLIVVVFILVSPGR